MGANAWDYQEMIYTSDEVLKDYDMDDVEWSISTDGNWVFGWHSNRDIPYGHWNCEFSYAGLTNSEDVSDKIPEALQSLWMEINEKIFNGKAIPVRCYANRHTFGTEGYIHTDTTRKEDHTVVIYLNPIWEAQWGGETVFYNDKQTEITASVLPNYKRIAVFPGTVPHKAAPLSRICNTVRTTLMFKVSIDPQPLSDDEEKLKTFLKNIGADTIPHRIGTLYEHLVRVYHILASMNAPNYVALAGGLHSVYGTNVFKDNPDIADSAVLEEFGPKVNHLVGLFGTIDRPKCLEEMDDSISDEDMFDLRCIECANLYDQSELNEKDYPNLFKFSREARKVLK